MGSSKVSKFVVLLLAFLAGVNLLFSEEDNDTLQHRRLASQQRNLARARLLDVNQCAIKVESEIQPLQEKWYSSHVPIFHDLIVVDGEYFAIFNMDGNTGNANPENYEDYHNETTTHEWWCDDERGYVVSEDESKHTLIVKCPNVKHKITAVPITNGKSKNKRKPSYNVESRLKCINEGPITFPSDITFGACTSIRGSDSRRYLSQWIEYHHLIGVEHFFVYINEPLSEMDNLYKKPYITYVPFDYFPKHSFYFQATWQNDCVYRAKNASVTWVNIHDTDEYFEPQMEPYDMNSVVKDIDPNEVGNIIVYNTFWGPHPEEPETHNKFDVLMDYTWRSPPNGPHKNIVSPKLIDYFYVHHVTGRTDGSRELFLKRRIRMNHFRRPYDHVHAIALEDSDKLIKDETFRDRYVSDVKKAVYDIEKENFEEEEKIA